MLVMHGERLHGETLERQQVARPRWTRVENAPPDRGGVVIPLFLPQRDREARQRIGARRTIAHVGGALVTRARIDGAARLLVDAAKRQRLPRIGADLMTATDDARGARGQNRERHEVET